MDSFLAFLSLFFWPYWVRKEFKTFRKKDRPGIITTAIVTLVIIVILVGGAWYFDSLLLKIILGALAVLIYLFIGFFFSISLLFTLSGEYDY